MPVTLFPPPEDRLTDDEIRGWAAVPAAVAADLVPEEQLDPEIRPVRAPGQQPAMLGRALTVACTPPDFGAVVHVLDVASPADVVVIAAGADCTHAMIGDILGGHLRNRGCAGVVCDGAVRDAASLAGWADFPVFARSINPRGPASAEDGTIGAPVRIGNRTVHSGELVLGDADGLVCLSRETVRSRLPDALAKLALEEKWVAGLAAGDGVEAVFGVPPIIRK